MRTALVIGGGGSKGAFAVGAIEVLLDHGLHFDLVAGTSTGALLAPMVAVGDVASMVAHYTMVKTRDVIRKNWRGLFWRSLYHTRPLEKRVRKWVEAHYAEVDKSHTKAIVCAVSLQSKRVLYFSQKSSLNTILWHDSNEMVCCMMGSTNQPFLMPPIDFMGHQLVDGGVREIAPVRIVLQEGADKVYVIVHSPENPSGNRERYTNIFTIGERALDLMTDEVVKDDLDIGDASIVLIRPACELPTNGLTFEPDVMQQMRELGKVAAKSALDSGCVH